LKTLVYILILVIATLGFRIVTSPEWQASIGDFASGAVKPILVPLVELINHPAFVYTLAVLIFAAGIAACAAYWLRGVRPRLHELAAVRRGVDELPVPSVRDTQARWLEAMHGLGALLRAHGTFISAWSGFQTRAGRSGGIPDAPFSHFVASEPQQARDRSGLMQSLPGYFTSLGLIFTFVGLVVALYFAAKGFRSGNIEDAKASIIQLLNAASFKFLTSVAALISALMASLVLRFGQSVIGRSTRDTAERIESFLSAWREQVGTGLPGEGAAAAQLLARVEVLVESVQALTQALEGIVRQEPARLAGHDHASG
jgi:hypothetical protein